MKPNILFTGASSFTGYWFVNELTRMGFHVVTVFTGKDLARYAGIRAARIRLLTDNSTPVFGCRFGDSAFLDLVRKERFDVLCHHGSCVTNYNHPDFDLFHAVQENTLNIRESLELLQKNGCRALIWTGSVFEPNEGAGDSDTAFSPYGLSKSFSWEIIRYYAGLLGLKAGKFVIPNPFGPYEEARFTTYLVKTWAGNRVADVNTPGYYRDNIHADLLAKVYAGFVRRMTNTMESVEKINPSGYRGTQGEFAERFAAELRPRLGLPCLLNLRMNHPFTEPRVRYNTQPVDHTLYGWDEKKAWDDLALYYRRHVIHSK
jgi:nucleoside-diphosphate-sugar epimerase